jgi:hypothetical protein
VSYYCRKTGGISFGEIKNNFMLLLLCKSYAGKKKGCYNRENYFFHTEVFELKVGNMFCTMIAVCCYLASYFSIEFDAKYFSIKSKPQLTPRLFA